MVCDCPFRIACLSPLILDKLDGTLKHVCQEVLSISTHCFQLRHLIQFPKVSRIMIVASYYLRPGRAGREILLRILNGLMVRRY